MSIRVPVLVAALLTSTHVLADEPQPQCVVKRVEVEILRKRLAKAVEARETWVKAHCKLVYNSNTRPIAGRYWVCDGKFAGNEGTVLESQEERDLRGFLYNALARVDVCCASDPPNWCKRD